MAGGADTTGPLPDGLHPCPAALGAAPAGGAGARRRANFTRSHDSDAAPVPRSGAPVPGPAPSAGPGPGADCRQEVTAARPRSADFGPSWVGRMSMSKISVGR